ncbi:MAG: hypothetical protein ACPL28_08020 [bacterium]
MNFEEVVLKVIEILNQMDIPYFFTGAIAVVYYGEPRTTHDIDLVIVIKDSDVNTMIVNFEKEFFIDEVSIESAIKEKSMFNAMHKETGFKVDFWILGDDDFNQKRFMRRVKVEILGTTMYLPTAEDAIISKLEWFKMSDIDKHYFDALGIYRIQKEKLDMQYIDSWCKQKSTLEMWEKIQKEGI